MAKKISVFRSKLKSLNLKKAELNSQKKAVQAECTHGGKKNHFLKVYDKENNILKCRECRTKLDLGEIQKVVDNANGDKPKAVKKYVKTSFRRVNNLLQIAKLNINGGCEKGTRDHKLYKAIVGQIKGNFVLEKLMIGLYADNLKAISGGKGGRNRHNGKKKKTVSIAYGTKGMF